MHQGERDLWHPTGLSRWTLWWPFRRTGHKVLQLGYYWPTIFKEAEKYVKAYDNCQRMGRPGQADEMPLKPQLVVEPFEWWELDFIGPFNPQSNQKIYIFFVTDYVMKWVEVVALSRATEESVIKFLFELFVRYNLPREVITNVGAQFTGNKITSTLRNHHIIHRVTSPYHSQEKDRKSVV